MFHASLIAEMPTNEKAIAMANWRKAGQSQKLAQENRQAVR
jgi:hypothetical protein